MIYVVTLSALAIGIVAGWMLASKFMLRVFAVFIVGLGGTIVLILNIPPTDRSALYLATILCAPPLLAGLIGGLVADNTGLLDDYLTFQTGPTRSDFLRAGSMHDASYLGGALGLIAAFFPMRRARAIDHHNASKEAPHAAT